MQPSATPPASKSALVLLLLAVACTVGEPLVDRPPFVPPPEPVVFSCFRPSTLCSMPPFEVNAIAARALSTTACVPMERNGSIAQSNARGVCLQSPPRAGLVSADVLLRADEPRDVVISGVSVVDVRLRLDGPVTLIFRGLTQLADVEIATDSPEAAVVFDDSRVERVTLGDVSAPFAGHVEARHSRFDRLSMVAASFELDSVMIEGSFVSVDFMSSGDGLFREVVLELGDGLFAPSRLEGITIVRCNTLAFFGAQLDRATVPRCESDEPTRLYGTEATMSVIDGVILGDGGAFDTVAFGRYQPSDYVLWDVSVTGSMFCDQAIRLKSTAHIRCSHCTESAFGAPAVDACNLEPPEEERSEAEQNLCEPLNLQTECSGSVPDRLRPLANYWL